MPRQLVVPALLMTLALVAYSTGVWSERTARLLKVWHVAAFWTGLAFDAAGTYGMNRLAASIDPEPFHTWTGIAAFSVMAVHAAWAAVTVRVGSSRARETFHRFSVPVWLLWLVPYVGGWIFGVTRG